MEIICLPCQFVTFAVYDKYSFHGRCHMLIVLQLAGPCFHINPIQNLQGEIIELALVQPKIASQLARCKPMHNYATLCAGWNYKRTMVYNSRETQNIANNRY